MSIRPGGNYYEMKCLSLSYRLCCSVSPRTDVAQSIMSSISGVDGLPGHPHAERSFFIDLHASHPVPRSWRVGQRNSGCRSVTQRLTQWSMKLSQPITESDGIKMSSFWHLICSYHISVFGISKRFLGEHIGTMHPPSDNIETGLQTLSVKQEEQTSYLIYRFRILIL